MLSSFPHAENTLIFQRIQTACTYYSNICRTRVQIRSESRNSAWKIHLDRASLILYFSRGSNARVRSARRGCWRLSPLGGRLIRVETRGFRSCGALDKIPKETFGNLINYTHDNRRGSSGCRPQLRANIENELFTVLGEWDYFRETFRARTD